MTWYNEPDRKWNRKMRRLVQEMIHYRNGLFPDEEPDAGRIAEYEKRYRKVLATAKDEYDYIPPSDYYREGYNLYRYMSNHLLLLHAHRVPTTNNPAERLKGL